MRRARLVVFIEGATIKRNRRSARLGVKYVEDCY